jgi:hypothetical protein
VNVLTETKRGALRCARSRFSNAALLHPNKLQVNTAYTEEMARHTNIEAVVRLRHPAIAEHSLWRGCVAWQILRG